LVVALMLLVLVGLVAVGALFLMQGG